MKVAKHHAVEEALRNVKARRGTEYKDADESFVQQEDPSFNAEEAGSRTNNKEPAIFVDDKGLPYKKLDFATGGTHHGAIGDFYRFLRENTKEDMFNKNGDFVYTSTDQPGQSVLCSKRSPLKSIWK